VKSNTIGGLYFWTRRKDDSKCVEDRAGDGKRVGHVLNTNQTTRAVSFLADFRAIASRIVLLNQAGSLRGAWKQATRRRLLHGAKADGEGG